jgi:adenine deaminase
MGVNISFPGDAEAIDAKGQHVYPGLIDSYSSIGLIEIDSIRASIDTTETGNLNPNVRAAVAFNPDSEAIPVARANGVLSSVIVPNGGLVAGRSAVMMLENLGESAAAELLAEAINHVTREGKTLTKDLGGNSSTTEVGDAISQAIAALSGVGVK